MKPDTHTLIRGLYAITPDLADTAQLLDAVEETLSAGTRLVQYRNKAATPGQRREQLQALKVLCERYGCTLVVNDDWQAAIDLGIPAVHIGSDDGDVAAVRAAIGPEMLLGVSCYASLDRARALLPYADYFAFGSMFTSTTKPQARPATLGILREARKLGKPVVAIGGITLENARQVFEAGADAIAVISGVFGAASTVEASGAFLAVAADHETRLAT
jgi:thiamine-phosphate pyrophosphorylase